MSDHSRIEWTDATWNPVTGCTPISAGCRNCYALRMARRLQAMGKPAYARGPRVTEHPEALEWPLERRWRSPHRVFVCSMSDLFHPEVSDRFIERVIDVIARDQFDDFLILTKRPERARLFFGTGYPPPPNVWLGVTVENEAALDRIDQLLQVPAAVRFLSLEPLLERVDLAERLDGIDWVIVGGETGPGRRPMDPGWPRLVRDQCRAAHLPFFFKRWGHLRSGAPGEHELDGVTYHQWPRPRGGRDR